MKKAQYNALVAEQQAIAAQAGPKANAIALQEVKKQEVKVQEVETEARIAVSVKEAERKQKELIATQIRPAEAQKEAVVIAAEGEASAAVVRPRRGARPSASAPKARRPPQIALAEAEKVRLAAEGRGRRSDADRAKRQAAGEGEGAAIRARGEAEGAAIRAKGLAEGEAIQAKLVAEAAGILKKAEAYKALDRAAMIQMILEKAPRSSSRNSASPPTRPSCRSPNSARASAPAWATSTRSTSSTWAAARRDGKATPSRRYAMTVPDVLFGILAKLKTLGIDVDGLLKQGRHRPLPSQRAHRRGPEPRRPTRSPRTWRSLRRRRRSSPSHGSQDRGRPDSSGRLLFSRTRRLTTADGAIVSQGSGRRSYREGAVERSYTVVVASWWTTLTPMFANWEATSGGTTSQRTLKSA